MAFLGVTFGVPVGRFAGALWPANNSLQPLQPMAEGRRLGSSHGRDRERPRRRRTDDRHLCRPCASAGRHSSPGSRHPYHHGQLRHSQDGCNQNLAGTTRTTMCTSRQHRRRGPIRSSAGLPNSPGSRFVAASIPRRSSWKQISPPSSSGTMKIPSRIDGPNPRMKSSRPSNASAKRPSRLYAANFRFT